MPQAGRFISQSYNSFGASGDDGLLSRKRVRNGVLPRDCQGIAKGYEQERVLEKSGRDWWTSRLVRRLKGNDERAGARTGRERYIGIGMV